MGLLTQAIGENNLACLHVLSSAIIRHLGKRVNEFCIKIPQEDLGMRGKNLWITKHAKHATRKAAKGNQAPFRGFRDGASLTRCKASNYRRAIISRLSRSKVLQLPAKRAMQ